MHTNYVRNEVMALATSTAPAAIPTPATTLVDLSLLPRVSPILGNRYILRRDTRAHTHTQTHTHPLSNVFTPRLCVVVALIFFSYVNLPKVTVCIIVNLNFCKRLNLMQFMYRK